MLIEVALAAVGIMVLAFVAARVAQWINQSMVDRNESYQQTRLDAGKLGAGLVRFEGPREPIHLIGPGPERTPGLGPQATSSYDRSCPAADALLASALADRQNAAVLMGSAADARQQAVDHSNQAKALTDRANQQWKDADDKMREAAEKRARADGMDCWRPGDCDEICDAPVPPWPPVCHWDCGDPYEDGGCVDERNQLRADADRLEEEARQLYADAQRTYDADAVPTGDRVPGLVDDAVTRAREAQRLLADAGRKEREARLACAR